MLHKKEKEIHQIAEDLANAGSNVPKEEFLRQMRMMHRTNQQLFAGLVLAWLQDYAGYPTDARNYYSVDYCKKLLEAFREAYPGEPLCTGFPLI